MTGALHSLVPPCMQIAHLHRGIQQPMRQCTLLVPITHWLISFLRSWTCTSLWLTRAGGSIVLVIGLQGMHMVFRNDEAFDAGGCNFLCLSPSCICKVALVHEHCWNTCSDESMRPLHAPITPHTRMQHSFVFFFPTYSMPGVRVPGSVIQSWCNGNSECEESVSKPYCAPGSFIQI